MTTDATDAPQSGSLAPISRTDQGKRGASPMLQGLDNNPAGHSGPQFWNMFREILANLYTLSLPHPSEEARFTLATRTYPTTRAILMRSRGTAFTMTRGPALIAHGADQLLIVLQLEGSCDFASEARRARIETGDVYVVDYARPFHSAASDYANLIVHLTRDSVPAAFLALEPHGLVFPRDSGAARLTGAAIRELFDHADGLTVSDAEAAIEGIVAMTMANARTKLADDEADHVKSRRKAALDYIDAHLGDSQLGPEEIAEATNVSRASLYRLLAAEGGIRAVLLTRRLDQAMRLMLADAKDERSTAEIARSCGFGGTSQFTRAFTARFGLPPRQYLALLRQQDLDWQEARLIGDGFERVSLWWREENRSRSQRS